MRYDSELSKLFFNPIRHRVLVGPTAFSKANQHFALKIDTQIKLAVVFSNCEINYNTLFSEI